MFRRYAAIVLIFVTFFALGLWGRSLMPTPTLTIGSGGVTLLQNGTLVDTTAAIGGGPIAATLPAPSTAGTALVVVVSTGTASNGVVNSMPTGFTKLAADTTLGVNSIRFEIWAFLNNPGGIAGIAIQVSISGLWHAHMSEWSNVGFTSAAVESTGVTDNTVGTTLQPISGAVLNPGDLVIAGWEQKINSPGAVTFTTPSGFTRLIDNSANAITDHIDVEYQIGSQLNAPSSPILTSNTATNPGAAAAIVVLKAATPSSDASSFIRHSSVTAKLNTLDLQLVQGGKYLLEDGSGYYQLEDGSGDYLLDTYVPQLGDPVAMLNPTWNGRIVDTTTEDVADTHNNYRLVTIAATNSAVAPGGSAPGDLTDVAPVGGYFLLEDGSGRLLLEDGSGLYEQEGTTYNYRGLSVRLTQNHDGSVTTYGKLITYEPGYQAGQTFNLTSQNQGYSAQPFTITNVIETFLHQTPAFQIEFGSAYQTLALAGGGVLTQQGSQAVIQQQIAMPAGTLGFAQVTSNQTPITTTTDLTGLTVTVTVAAGRRISIDFALLCLSSTLDAQFIVAVNEGATILSEAATICAAVSVNVTCTGSVILTPTTGVHTYKLTGFCSAGTGQLTASTTTPAYIMVEDIGT